MIPPEDSHKDVKASLAPLTVAIKTSLDSWPCALAASFDIEVGRRTVAVVAKAARLETGALNVYELALSKSKVIVAKAESMVCALVENNVGNVGRGVPRWLRMVAMVGPERYLSCL